MACPKSPSMSFTILTVCFSSVLERTSKQKRWFERGGGLGGPACVTRSDKTSTALSSHDVAEHTINTSIYLLRLAR